MTHRHRRWHALLWAVLGPLVLIGLAAGLAVRPGTGQRAAAPWDAGAASGGGGS